jgi:hypothetical protein
MTRQDPIDDKLDYALEMTFPASDPFTVEPPRVPRDRAVPAGAERVNRPEPAAGR